MATLAEMRALARNIINQPDPSNSNFTDAKIDEWINQGYRKVITRLESIPITERTYTSAEEITLNARTLKINMVRIKEQPVDEFKRLPIIDFETLGRIDEDWENEPADIPRVAVRSGAFKIRLYPAPNAANTGVDVKVVALEFPSDLSSDSAVPDLPLNIHDILPAWAAYRAYQQLGEFELAGVQRQEFNQMIQSQHAITTKFSDQGNRWKFAQEYRGNESSPNIFNQFGD